MVTTTRTSIKDVDAAWDRWVARGGSTTSVLFLMFRAIRDTWEAQSGKEYHRWR